MSVNSSIKVRLGKKADVEAAFALILELAQYEKAEHEVSNTIAMMERDGFGGHPAFEFYVAEKSDKIIGLSLFYYRYSTWKGRRLYLEDIIVTEAERGIGAGKMLFEATIAHAKANQCTGMMWQVLEWNEPSIKFYERYGTHFDGEWLNCHLNF